MKYSDNKRIVNAVLPRFTSYPYVHHSVGICLDSCISLPKLALRRNSLQIFLYSTDTSEVIEAHVRI